MSTLEQVDFGSLTKSPSVPILVADMDEYETYTFHIHPALLEKCSPQFARQLKSENLDDLRDQPALIVHTRYETFGDFCNWLYRGRVTNESNLTGVHSLLEFAHNWEIASLQKYMADWIQQRCKNPCDVMILLRDRLCRFKWVNESLVDYLLKKIAFEMTTNGYANFIEAAPGEWERFISMKEPLSSPKGQYRALLKAKVEAAEELCERGELKDPATSACKWHDHQDDAEEKKACHSCNPGA